MPGENEGRGGGGSRSFGWQGEAADFGLKKRENFESRSLEGILKKKKGEDLRKEESVRNTQEEGEIVRLNSMGKKKRSPCAKEEVKRKREKQSVQKRNRLVRGFSEDLPVNLRW